MHTVPITYCKIRRFGYRYILRNNKREWVEYKYSCKLKQTCGADRKKKLPDYFCYRSTEKNVTTLLYFGQKGSWVWSFCCVTLCASSSLYFPDSSQPRIALESVTGSQLGAFPIHEHRFYFILFLKRAYIGNDVIKLSQIWDIYEKESLSIFFKNIHVYSKLIRF